MIKLKRTTPSADDNLTTAAYQRIKEIYISHAQQAYLEIANYLFETFFDSDLDLMRKKQPAPGKAASFNKLCERLNKENAGLPKRSWLFNSLGLYIDAQELDEPEIVQTYGQLSASHKVLLLGIHDKAKKIELINETLDGGYSVRDLRNRVAELKPRKAKGKSRAFDEARSLESLLGHLTKCDEKCSVITSNLGDADEYLEMHSMLTGMIKSISQRIEKIRKKKESK